MGINLNFVSEKKIWKGHIVFSSTLEGQEQFALSENSMDFIGQKQVTIIDD